MLQATWNFAEFGKIVTDLDMEKVEGLLKWAIPLAREFKDFKTEVLDKENERKIEYLFNQISSPKGMDKKNEYKGVVVREERLRAIRNKDASDYVGKRYRRHVAFGAVGAAKLLHMLNPQFFVMWDTAIRGADEKFDYSKIVHYYSGSEMIENEEYREFDEDGKGYFEFLKAVKDNFVEKNKLELPSWYPSNHTFTKAIDEFNFSVMHNL